jgi:hypothetical protein
MWSKEGKVCSWQALRSQVAWAGAGVNGGGVAILAVVVRYEFRGPPPG